MGLLYYVVHTEPNEEAISEANVRALGHDPFLPYETFEKTRRGYVTTGVRWLFPSYFFVPFDVQDLRWREINYARGVKRILGSNPERPTPVPAGAVESIREQFARGVFRPSPAVPISGGERARVMSGTFADKVGTCQWSSRTRCQLLLELFGGAVTVEFPVSAVKREAAEAVA